MKIIDAINKINKEEKFRFRLLCNGFIYKYSGGSLYNETVGERAEWIIDNKWLNEEIEIIEDTPKEEKKIPEKLNYQYRNLYGRLSQHKQSEIDIIDTLNGVIDYLKSKGDE